MQYISNVLIVNEMRCRSGINFCHRLRGGDKVTIVGTGTRIKGLTAFDRVP